MQTVGVVRARPGEAIEQNRTDIPLFSSYKSSFRSIYMPIEMIESEEFNQGTLIKVIGVGGAAVMPLNT